MSVQDIVRERHVYVTTVSYIGNEAMPPRLKSGTCLALKDGTYWFHPDDGSRPIELSEALGKHLMERDDVLPHIQSR